jgi:hypothetical protein
MMTGRRTLAAASLALLLFLGLTRPASAGIINEPDESPKWFTTALSISWWFPAESNTSYTSVYGDGGKAIWRLNFGIVPVARYVQLEFGASFGFHQKGSYQVGESSSEVSGENIMMTLTPLRWGMRLGIDPVSEFPIVPYGQLGFDYVMWKEHSSSDDLRGGKGGWHYGFGLAFLLDRLEPLRAGRNDAGAGLNDAFITVDATNMQYMPQWQSDSGLDLTGWQLTVGLKLDF